MFRDIKNVKTIIIPASVEIIGYKAFENSDVEEVVIKGENLKEIYSYDFNGCVNLSTINLPSSLTNIGQAAFQGCPKIKIVKDENGKYSAQPK